MRYRSALIGCGRIGWEYNEGHSPLGIYSHAAAYLACEQTHFIAVCDVERARAQRCADQCGGPVVYQSPAEMLARERPELVSVCTPDATHPDLIRLALSNPGVRAVLAEKPLALDLEAAQELTRLARDRGVLLVAES